MMKCVVTGSRSGTPPSSAVNIRCLEVMFMVIPAVRISYQLSASASYCWSLVS